MKRQLLTSSILGVIGLVTAGLIGFQTPVMASDDLAKLDDEEVTIAREDDGDDDDGSDDTTTNATAGTGTGTGTGAQTGGTDDPTTGDATNSVTTGVSVDQDVSNGDLTGDLTNDGPGDTLTHDETSGHTNDASRHDTRG
jgi:hypothetical protein